jgi:ABC-type protease/lipase transport system fused ATPase/permease subunit
VAFRETAKCPDDEVNARCSMVLLSSSLTSSRFLHARHLIHRQTLLLYITHRVTDAFQQEIMRTCVKRCIVAAYDSINQVRTLHHQNKLSSFWHNSHCKCSLDVPFAKLPLNVCRCLRCSRRALGLPDS